MWRGLTLLGVLLALLVVALMSARQARTLVAPNNAPSSSADTPRENAADKATITPQQYKQKLDEVMQPRPMPEEAN